MANLDGLALETSGLTKVFDGQSVVDGIDLMVPQGSIFGFLGPNGSGKTTTIRMLLGLAFASSGLIRLLGKEMPAMAASVLPEVGAVVEGPAFYPWLSGRANLARIDSVGRDFKSGTSEKLSKTRRTRVADALDRVGLASAANKAYRSYSLGMRQRLGLAAALLRPSQLLILDEPTNGLDPQGMREVRALIKQLAAEGTTVFLSSHLLGEIEQVCTHGAMMRAGRLVAQGSLQELRSGQRETVRICTPDIELAEKALVSMVGLGSTMTIEPHTLRVELLGVKTEDLVYNLVNGGVRIREVQSEAPTLEDAFVALTGEGFDV